MTRWSDGELRDAIRQIPETTVEYGAWWGSAEGAAFVDQIARFGAPVVAKQVKAAYDFELAVDEVISILFLLLEPNRPGLRQRLVDEQTNSPWAYLYVSLRGAAFDEAGQFQRRPIDDGEVEVREHRLGEGALSLDDMAEATTNVLTPVTPGPLRRTLGAAVGWLADRAVDGRLSHLHTNAGKSEELAKLGFEGKKARVLANVTLGSRPDHSKTSLFAAFLMDPTWTPDYSATHSRAIFLYGRRMRREIEREAS